VIVESLRDGLYAEIGFAGEDIAEISLKRSPVRRPAAHQKLRRRLNAVYQMLDAIGWETSATDADVQVDLRAQDQLALTVLRRQLAAETDALKDLQAAERVDAAERVRVLGAYIAEVEQQTGRTPRTDSPGKLV
jgi:hypothetical protein